MEKMTCILSATVLVSTYEEVIRMGRIVASVTISSVLEPDKIIRCDTLVNTGASLLVLPSA